MTPDFLAGIIVALLPSMLVLAWLAWQAPLIDDQQLD